MPPDELNPLAADKILTIVRICGASFMGHRKFIAEPAEPLFISPFFGHPPAIETAIASVTT
jgi:hypothetical protein